MSTSSPRLSCRAAAAGVLNEVLFHGASLTPSLTELPAYLSAEDKALAQELCFGVCRYAHSLDGIITALLQKPLKAKEQIIHGLLMMGAYQLLYTRIPDHAAIGATVEVTRELRKPWATGLTNGVLRKIQRANNSTQKPWPESQTILTSHPEWLLKRLQNAWPEHWQETVEANNTQAPMWLRVNTKLTSREAYLQALAECDIPASAGTRCDTSIRLHQAVNVQRLPGFNSGWVSVQDEAAQLSAALLELEPKQRVLDACAAPGGKTCHILEHCDGLRELVALDLESSRLTRVQENLSRLNLSATLVAADAVDLDAWWDGHAFDRILLDAPCSATGVIRRHPDIKWLRRADDIDKLVALQQQLLRSLWRTLRPGGTLVYATCSVLPEENWQNIAHFTDVTADARHMPIEAEWGFAQPYGRQLLPAVSGNDGFYYARLQKFVP